MNILTNNLQGILDEATTAWGIKVERVEMWVSPLPSLSPSYWPHLFSIYRKDARLPEQLQRAMAAEAEAAREARAKVIAAEGEKKASGALREASEIISESPAALQLRYLQVVIALQSSTTITTTTNGLELVPAFIIICI